MNSSILKNKFDYEETIKFIYGGSLIAALV